MTTLLSHPGTQLADFQRLLAAYQQATERLKDSHDLLMGEVARLRAELASKNQQLERRKRLAALGEMAAAVAHEVRNPLGSIQLYADLLGRQLADRPDQAELADRIGAAVGSLDAIVSDMLTFTRLIEPDRRPTVLADLVAEAAADAAPRLASAGVVLCAEGIDRRLVLAVDPRLFRRVLLNLMLNAADAMSELQTDSPEGPAKTLTITAEALDGGADSPRWRIAVADSGPGIAPDVLEKMFHPFFTTKDHGTGLGLAIVHHIVEAHGGTISAANRPEGGAMLTITLP